MASTFTNYFQTEIANYIKGTTLTPPTSWYIGLFTLAPTNVGGGTECSGNGYTRVQVVAATGFTALSGTSPVAFSNGGAITFPTATSTGYGTAVAYGWFDAATSGNLISWNTLTSSIVITGGVTPVFNAGVLQMYIGT